MEYNGYKIEQAHVPGCRKGFLIFCTWDELEGVPAFRTLSAAKKAIDALERGEFHFQFATRKEATRWRDANHIRWEVREEDGMFCVIPDEWHRRLYQEVDWTRVTPQDVANAVNHALERIA